MICQAGIRRRAWRSKSPISLVSSRMMPTTFFFSSLTTWSARASSYSTERPRSKKGTTSSRGPLVNATPMNTTMVSTLPASALTKGRGVIPNFSIASSASGENASGS